jgi:hypothetical protein
MVGLAFGWCWTNACRTESTSLVNRSGSDESRPKTSSACGTRAAIKARSSSAVGEAAMSVGRGRWRTSITFCGDVVSSDPRRGAGGLSPRGRCARPGSGRRGGAAVQSRPARQGHMTGACRRQDVGQVRQRRPCRRRRPPRRVGGMPARVRWRAAEQEEEHDGPQGRGRRARCRGPARRGPLQDGEGFGAMASYDAHGLLIAGLPWRHAMS